MKTSHLKFLLYLAVVLVIAGCGGGSKSSSPITVSITGAPTTIAPSAMVTLSAVVTNDTAAAGVTWGVTGGGTFTSTTTQLIYTAPATVPSPATVTVTATSITDPTKSATPVTFTITAPALSVSITNPIGSINVGGEPVSVDATVANDGATPGVAWTLVSPGTTADCQPGCGTITNPTTTSVLYSPPSTLPSPAAATLIATSNSDNTQSASDNITLTSTTTNVQALNGPYAFVLSGFDASGNALILGGIFTADGDGNITSGEIDVNDNGTNTNTTNPPAKAVTGTYTLDANLHGMITLAIPLDGFSSTPTFSFTLDSTSNSGGMISLDSANAAVSGSFNAQTSTAAPSGSYIFRLASDAPARTGAVGQFTVGDGGAISTGLFDSADVDNGNDDVASSLTGTFAAPDANGAGRISLTPGGNFNYYVVSSNQVLLLQTDNSLQSIGVIRAQNLSAIIPTTVNVADVFGVIGGDSEGGDRPDLRVRPKANLVAKLKQFASVAAGQLVVTGGTTSAVVADLNDAGGINQQVEVTGSVTFDATTGRGTVTLPEGFEDGFIDSFVFYLASDGSGVMLDTTGFADASTASYPEALVGDLLPQTATSAIAGTVQGVDEISAQSDIPVVDTVINVSDDSLNGFTDGALAGVGTQANATLSGTSSAVDSTGRATGTVSSTVYGDGLPFALYAVSATQYFVVAEQAGSVSSLGIFTSQTIPAATTNARISRQAAASGHTFPKPKGRPASAKVHGHTKAN